MGRIASGSIRSWAQADRFLGRAQSLNTGQRSTEVVRESDTVIRVWYHRTPVVTYYKPGTTDKVATMDTQGWKTPTTINRMQEFVPEGVEIFTAGEDEDGHPEMVMLRDEKNGVENHPLTAGPYHMGNKTPERRRIR